MPPHVFFLMSLSQELPSRGVRRQHHQYLYLCRQQHCLSLFLYLDGGLEVGLVGLVWNGLYLEVTLNRANVFSNLIFFGNVMVCPSNAFN